MTHSTSAGRVHASSPAHAAEQLDLLLRDPSTGEVVQAVAVPSRRRPRSTELGAFVRMSQRAAAALAISSELTGRDYRVLLAILSLAGYENVVTASLADIDAVCKLGRPHVSRSVRRLISMGVLWERSGGRGRPRALLLDPYTFARGRSDSIRRLQEQKQSETRTRVLKLVLKDSEKE